MIMKLTKEDARKALLGGLLLGGGGGGLISGGFHALEETFARTEYLTMLSVDELAPEDIVITVSMLGAPSKFGTPLTTDHWQKALTNFEQNYGRQVAGFISCENGAASTANGWILSALTGIPVIDAPCNGRAHPTGTMGSMGLNGLPDYQTTQSACGGEGESYLETVATGALQPTSHVIRQSAAAAGGMVGVVRNPVTAAFLAEHAAPGAIRQAMEIGEIYLAAGNGDNFVRRLQEKYEARVLVKGAITDYDLKMEGGYDIGTLTVAGAEDAYTLTFWNEFMFAEKDGARVATFPDLICILDAQTGEAISTAEAKAGREVYAIVIPQEKLMLGAGMHQRELFQEAEDILGADMTACNEKLFR